MPRDHRVTAHVSEATRKELERNADEEEMSLSAYINKLLERQLLMEAEDEVSSHVRATEQLQRTIDEGQRQLRNIGKEVENKNRKAGAYGVAAFVLLQREYSEEIVNAAIEAGNRRLHEDEFEGEQSQDDDDEGLDIEELRGEKDGKTDGGDNYDPFDPLADGGERE